MDMNFTQEELAFRDEVRTFLQQNVDPVVRRKLVETRHITKDEQVAWQRTLNRKGWSVPHWPVAHGGTGWGAAKQYIFLEELQKYPAPSPLPFGANMVGPVIYTFGNEQQQNHFLPRIANMDDWWCQGFSEPGAGSDLASLKTTAKKVGHTYIVNGQKTWTTLAQHANWIFCLCRTDPGAKKQAGISFLLINMQSKGISCRPIEMIDGGVEINEIFFDEVVVPAENLVGEENRGWDYAKFLLGLERVNIARVGISKARIARIRELASQTNSGGRPLIEDPQFRQKLAATEIELKALELTQMRVVAAESKHGKNKPDPASSILKLKGSEIQQTLTELLLEVAGPFALRFAAENGGQDEKTDWAAPIAQTYFNYRKVSIYGGSSEIQRNIIAKAVLGL
ncbi:pimeloyl-CoA dehydrogenase large subunit [Rhodopseudomonas palustris]|uniref:Pimeloyl-CoA dehydrogenase large subunit n=1 Tax=Rhodopseudomonas palustris TaxID=1076 RepID=A0A323UV99_RHOPL|nr:pimeloyl-CoA dehydrogenase large subunit [Rhodopseudomonas palustris]PZA11538.1 pimeloyl-CoA dehydrogenase large subunit [Rhodopseudomonas palustris]